MYSTKTSRRVLEALKCPPNVRYDGDNKKMFETWGLGPVIRTGNGYLTDESNADYLEKELTRLEAAGEIEEDSWNRVYVDHYEHFTYRVIDRKGAPTKVFAVMEGVFSGIKDCGLLDPNGYKLLAHTTQKECIRNNAPCLRDDLPEDWEGQAWQWLQDNSPAALSDLFDNGDVAEEDVDEACAALGFLEADESVV